MKARGILFVTDLIIATEEDIKTMTRRIVKPQPIGEWAAPGRSMCPYGVPGDRLYVKETYATCEKCGRFVYKAKSPNRRCPACDTFIARWKSGRFMPKDAARLWLEIINVRVERLQDISEADAKAEGTQGKHSFAALWDAINGKRASWASNPWVWVVEFKRITP